MNAVFAVRGKDGHRPRRRNLVWLIPVVAIVGTGLFYGVGTLVAWLWRVTLADIFGIKPISFWQAWGLLLLAQLLFKANMQPTTHTGRRWRCVPAGGETPEADVDPPLPDRES